MDDEAREALDMSPEELAARWAKGEKAKVRKRDDFVQRMKRIVDESTAEPQFSVSAPVVPINRIQRTVFSEAAGKDDVERGRDGLVVVGLERK